MWPIITNKTNKYIKNYKNLELKSTDNYITDPKLITNMFNSFLSSISNSHINSGHLFKTFSSNTNDNRFFLFEVEPKEMNNIIKNLKS